MPIYEYNCKACDAKYEKMRPMSAADDAAKCPSCGSPKTARALSVFAVAAEGGAKSSPGGTSDAGPMCGRCGGPGPCAMG
jgi:putative FmdB family regulatory protein